MIKAIQRAKERIEIVIFRFDRSEIEKALIAAVDRGVFVHALVAHTNQGGEKTLRELEMRLLEAGVTVARTAGDLVRYHDKFLIVDRQELHVYGFNYTLLDMERSRSFGLCITDKQLVAEAVRLFEADTKRQAYEPESDCFVVSPLNARRRLAELLKSAKEEILIYDPKVSDAPMIRILQERAKAGVDVRIIGKLTRKSDDVKCCELPEMRLHTRTIVIDREEMFLGSQSLRATELDARREVGVIVRDEKAVAKVIQVFEKDWKEIEAAAESSEDSSTAAKVAKKAAKVVAKSLPPLAPVVAEVVKDVAGDLKAVEVDPEVLEESVKEAVREAVRDVIENAVGEAHA